MKIDPVIINCEREDEQIFENSRRRRTSSVQSQSSAEVSQSRPIWRVNSNVPLDFYFNPVSYIFAAKWREPSREPFKNKIVEKCLKLVGLYAPIAKVICLIFFRDAFNSHSYGEKTLQLQTVVLAGAKLLFQSDMKRVTTMYREIFKEMLNLVTSC